MKKLFTLLLSFAAVVSAYAFDKVVCTADVQAIDQPVRPASQWVDIEDDCYIVDDITTSFFIDFDFEVMTYEVIMQKDVNNPGLYRLVNPWQFWPMLPVAKRAGTITVSDDFYIEIDATDPDCVKIWPQDAGLEDEEGPATISSVYPLKDELQLSDMVATMKSGVLEDDVIRFEFPTSILLIQDGKGYASNPSGKFAIILPGGELPVNYEIDVDKEETFVPDEDNNYHFYVDAEDDRIPEIRWMLTTEYPTSRVKTTIAEEGTLCEIGDDVEVSVADVDARMAYVTFVSVNEEGDYEETVTFDVYPPANQSSWEYLGKATLTEDFFASFYKNEIQSETFEVDVERHKSVDGYYRINTAFDNWTYKDKLVQRDDYPGYIYFNITNPARPYLAQSFVGFTKEGDELLMSSNYCQRAAQLGLQIVENSKEPSGGVWENNVLTFDPEPGVFMRSSGKNADTWFYVNAPSNPEWDKTNPNAAPRFLAGKFKLDMNKALSGIGEIEVDNVETSIYYNLQGIKVKNPANGVYIVRKGSNVTKKFIK